MFSKFFVHDVTIMGSYIIIKAQSLAKCQSVPVALLSAQFSTIKIAVK
jgi:hypothetical protein